MKCKNIAIIGTNGLPGRYGGWDQLMEHLTKMLSFKYNFIVYCTTYKADTKFKSYNNAQLVYIPLKANGWQSVFYDIFSSLHALFVSDKVILLGGAGTIMFPILRLFNKEVIYHLAGIEWKRDKWSLPVQMLLRLFEKIGVRFCDKLISDNVEISNYIKQTYGKSSFLIEYGADHVLKRNLSNDIKNLYNLESGEYAFKVCRIVPENNLDLILESFKSSLIKLVIVGNWANSIYGKSLKKKYAGYDNFVLLDPIYDQEQLDMLRSNCGLYIHGHSVGGTNPSLVEAMYLGLNILAFDVSFNRSTTENSAIYFKNSEELSELINEYYTKRQIFENVGIRLQKIAYDRYIWSNIISKYDEMFNSKSIL